MPTEFLSQPDLDALTEEQQAVADAVASGPRSVVRGPVRLWLHSPGLADRAQKLGEFLRWGTSLEGRVSELVILVVARHYGCDYIWFNHSRFAHDQGLGKEVIEAILHNNVPAFAKDDEATAYEFTRAVMAGGRVPDELLRRAKSVFGERGVVEMGAIVSHYHGGAIVLGLADTVLPDGTRRCLP